MAEPPNLDSVRWLQVQDAAVAAHAEVGGHGEGAAEAAMGSNKFGAVSVAKGSAQWGGFGSYPVNLSPQVLLAGCAVVDALFLWIAADRFASDACFPAWHVSGCT